MMPQTFAFCGWVAGQRALGWGRGSAIAVSYRRPVWMRKYRSRAIPPFSVEAEGRCFLKQEDVREATLTCMLAMVTHVSECHKGEGHPST